MGKHFVARKKSQNGKEKEIEMKYKKNLEDVELL